MSRADAVRRDAEDPLAPLLERFSPAPDGIVYLDGSSLGRPSLAARAAGHAALEEWGSALITGWDRWLHLPEAVGDRLGADFLGAAPGQVVVGDSTTVDLYKLVAAAAADRPARRSLVVPEDDFPTDRYVLEGIAAAHGLAVRFGDRADADTAVLVRSAVDYRTAALVDVQAAQAAAGAAGAHLVWDCSHAVGVVPLELDAWGVRFAVGCSYKYLNGGPGAPAWLYVARAAQHLRSPIWGWFGQRDQFAMGPAYDPEPGIRRWLAGTPTVAALAVVDAAVADLAAVGIEALRTKSVALASYAVDLVDERLAPLGAAVGSPRDPARRGGHVAVVHPDARSLVSRLRHEHGVLVDFREPDVVRLGLSPSTTSFLDVWLGVDALARLLSPAGR